jgi:hypothetical protein
MEMAMSLARAYERRLAVIADSNKAPSSNPTSRVLPLKVPPSTPPSSTTTSSTPPAPPRSFKRLTAEEMAKHRRSGLCFNCDGPFTRGHKYTHLFDITVVNDYDNNDDDTDVDNNLLMTIGTGQSLV